MSLGGFSAEFMGKSMLPFIITLGLLLRGRLTELRVLLTALLACFILAALAAYGHADFGVDGTALSNNWVSVAVVDGVITFLFVYIPARLLYASKMRKQKDLSAAPDVKADA
jgi:hypothetical protein